MGVSMTDRFAQARGYVRRLEPEWVRQHRSNWKIARRQRQNRRMTTEDVFSRVYHRGEWGDGEYNSGIGTRSGPAVHEFLATVERLAAEYGFEDGSFVDLGCGDFVVGRDLARLSSSYVGVDIVAPLIGRNQREFGGANCRFVHLDIVRDELPIGDVCFVRQVLQHLSNEQISRVLASLAQYRFVVVSEHHPLGHFVANADKPHGGDTRVLMGSGVVLTEPPFNLPTQLVHLVGESSVDPDVPQAGVIRTYLITKPD